MPVTTAIIVLGLAALVAVAVLVGLTENRGQRAAWARIAVRRRELSAWERHLRAAAEAGLCPRCRRPLDPDQSDDG